MISLRRDIRIWNAEHVAEYINTWKPRYVYTDNSVSVLYVKRVNEADMVARRTESQFILNYLVMCSSAGELLPFDHERFCRICDVYTLDRTFVMRFETCEIRFCQKCYETAADMITRGIHYDDAFGIDNGDSGKVIDAITRHDGIVYYFMRLVIPIEQFAYLNARSICNPAQCSGCSQTKGCNHMCRRCHKYSLKVCAGINSPKSQLARCMMIPDIAGIIVEYLVFLASYGHL